MSIEKTIHGAEFNPEMSKIPLRLLGDRVLIRKEVGETKKLESGIMRPGSVDEAFNTGTVVSVGPGYKDYPVTVNVDETVRYNKTGVMEFFIENERGKSEHFDLLRCADIISVM